MTERHPILRIDAINDSGKVLRYTHREGLGYNGGMGRNHGPSYIIYNPRTKLLEFSFGTDIFVGEQDIDTLKKFLGEENSRFAKPFIRDEGYTTFSGERINETVHRTALRLKEQFEGRQYNVLETYPALGGNSVLCGARLGLKIESQNAFWGIVTDTDIRPSHKLGAKCYGLEGYELESP